MDFEEFPTFSLFDDDSVQLTSPEIPHCFHLSPTGARFYVEVLGAVRVNQEGNDPLYSVQSRQDRLLSNHLQRTENVLIEHRAHVASMLHFRNEIAARPFASSEIMDIPERQSCIQTMSSKIIPVFPDYSDIKVNVDEYLNARISSKDRLVSVCLSANRKSWAARFPALVQDPCRRFEGKWNWIFIEAGGSSASVPDNWKYPIWCLYSKLELECPFEAPASPETFCLPSAVESSDLLDCTFAPSYLENTERGLKVLRIVIDPSTTQTFRTLMIDGEWECEFILTGRDVKKDLFIRTDGNGRFLHIWASEDTEETVFLTSLAPKLWRQQYPLNQISTTMIHLVYLRTKVTSSNISMPLAQTRFDEEQELTLPGIGVFVARGIQNISASFEDRTILTLDVISMRCDFILANGEETSITLPSRLNLSGGRKVFGDLDYYLLHALDFAKWARMTPLERLQKRQEKRAGEVELKRVMREGEFWTIRNQRHGVQRDDELERRRRIPMGDLTGESWIEEVMARSKKYLETV